MRVLTLTQPWATLVAMGAKRIETRSWATTYRGPLLIHAAAGLGPVGGMDGLEEICIGEPFFSALQAGGFRRPSDLPRGALVARCDLHAVVSADALSLLKTYAEMLPNHSARVWRLTEQERAFGDYTPGRYAWLLADVQPLDTPIPARGQLGLWNWEGSL